MALTAAEKQKKYREKMKAENPDKYELAKMKNAERNKKRRKIKDYTDEDKEKERIKWRERKKRQKNKIFNDNQQILGNGDKNDSDINTEKIIRKARLAERRNMQRKWVQERTEFRDIISRLTKRIKTLRKKATRYQKTNEQLIQTVEDMKKQNTRLLEVNSILTKNEIHSNDMSPASKSENFVEKYLFDIPPDRKDKVKKQLFDHNILLSSLKSTYAKAKNNAERNVLKNVTNNEIIQRYNSTSRMAQYLGLKGKIRRNFEVKARKNKILNELKVFYERDDVSRATAGKKEYKTLKKNKQQRRYLLNTLSELYKKYKSEGGKMKYTTFKKYRPFYILSPKITNRETCACLIHENVTLKCNKLKTLDMIKTKKIEEIALEIVCNIKEKDCAYGDCSICKNKNVEINWEGKDTNEIVSWEEWNQVKLEYKKKGNTEETKLTKRMIKSQNSGTLQEFILKFNEELLIFKKHLFNIKHQYHQYTSCLKKLSNEEVGIHIDFSENWICKLTTEVQAMHFGASKKQITIHTGILHIGDQNFKTFATISPNNDHGPEAIWAHLYPILKYVKEEYPCVTGIHFLSDGPTSQYRQKKNFYLFSQITKQWGFTYSTWNFSESYHGKGAADGVGAAIKRRLDSSVSHGIDIPDAFVAFNVLREADSSIMIYYIPEEDVTKFKCPAGLKRAPGTLKTHQILNSEAENTIRFRDLSCFCNLSVQMGYCDCFDLKSHILLSNDNAEIEKKNIKRKKPTNKQNDSSKTIKRNKKIKLVNSSSDSDSEIDDEALIAYMETDDDMDVTSHSESSIKSRDSFILDEWTGFLISKKDAETAKTLQKSTNLGSGLNKKNVAHILEDLTIAVDKYVLVKFDTNKTPKYYVGKILVLKELNVTIDFMRKKSNGTFYWPQIQDVSDVNTFDIAKVLSNPINCRRGLLEFEDDLREYKVY